MSDLQQLHSKITELEKRNKELSLMLESAEELHKGLAAKDHRVSMSVIHSLILALDSRDPYTAGHSSRVALYSLWIAKELGVSGEDCFQFHQSALMHDIGKIGVPDKVLLKADSLDDEEFLIMSSHTTIGARILSRMEPYERMLQATEVAKYHHEKMDGSGYPEGLRGTEIPFFARIVAVADAFDAMTTDRPYAKGRSYRDGVAEVIRCKGTHFDPEMADAFEAVMRRRHYLDGFSGRELPEFEDVHP
ncbi:HD-GYP domain-containing protein [Paenibacillus doosanensis]|uniref:Cyclic di-GMP phosphodiesterase response regulator RpfG n=1 Tax=Paenibacillus konkukensis TaxID=2020716 RepID=A0ABY4RL06_9BACL|nr:MULTISPECIES: HD-GYP domain-containing protein [Paenibacillus]MCS7460130.1 HD-GYP domain-containing protein [Paenibacillus doosanensis]UQZ82788.1 Cyclic di-GMP phosphodiesterase response regulator RpfG [Paenibacillus konkukensis]